MVGTVEFKLNEFASTKRGIKTAYALQKTFAQKGLYITSTTASRLWKSNQQKLFFDTLAELCFVLDCQTNDLLVYTPPVKAKKPRQ